MVQVSHGGETIGLLIERDGADLGVLLSPGQAQQIASRLKLGERTALDVLLTELGWSKRELAKRLHLHENTVYQWEEAPGYAMAYLRLMAGLKRLME